MIKKNFWCGVLLGIISMQIFLIVIWIFRFERFKTKVYIDIKNNNTSSILTKQLCLLKITWPKKAIPTKSYSLAMLHLHHTKYSNHAQPRWQAKQLFHTYDILKTFSIFTQYMSVSHGYSTICGIEWWLWRRQKGRR